MNRYLGIYGILLLADTLFGSFGQVFWIIAAVRASRIIHQRLINSILSCTFRFVMSDHFSKSLVLDCFVFRWLDTVPTSRVITRCSQDCQAVDSMLPNLLLNLG